MHTLAPSESRSVPPIPQLLPAAGTLPELRLATVDNDGALGQPLSEHESIWQQLVRRELTLRSTFAHGERFYVLLQYTDLANGEGLTLRKRIVFERVVLGDTGRVTGQVLGLANSTVASYTLNSLRKLKLRSRERAVPLALALHLSRHALTDHDARASSFLTPEGRFKVLSLRNPSTSRFALLTAAERGVASLVMLGNSNSEIAINRNTSLHTVENQVVSIFRKFDASNRFQLMSRLLGVCSTSTTCPQ